MKRLEGKSGSNRKSTRSCFTKEQIRIMSEWIDSHTENPYPTELEKEQIAEETGLHVKQVSIWFTNTRKRKMRHLPLRGSRKRGTTSKTDSKDNCTKKSEEEEKAESPKVKVDEKQEETEAKQTDSSYNPRKGIRDFLHYQTKLFQMQMTLIESNLPKEARTPWFCMCDIPEFDSLNELCQIFNKLIE